jgi:voltage-gated potassium channel
MVRTRHGAVEPGWLLTQIAVLAAIGTVIYYVLPVPGQMRTSSWVLVFCVGLATLAGLIVAGIRRMIREGAEFRIRGLILLLCLSVLFFSYTDIILAAEKGQFAGLHTRTDALYFTVSTLATVGFGDVHAAGQTARAAVTVQIIFNLVFLGAALTMISGVVKERARGSLHRPETGSKDDGSASAS